MPWLQRHLSQLGQHAVLQREQIDAASGVQLQLGPAAIALARVAAAMYADFLDRDVDRVVSAGRSVRQRQPQ